MIITKISSLAFSFLFICVVFSQTENKYSTVNEYVDGLYTSYHENGSVKAEGNFYRNRRIGNWFVYDNKGEVLAHRQFDSLGNSIVLIPKHSGDSIIKLLEKRPNKVERNNDGIYSFQHIKESDVVWSKRVWSFVPTQHNSAVYNFDWLGLLKTISVSDDTSLVKELKIYKDDQFQTYYSDEERIDTENLTLHRLGLKKDYFYDLSSRKMDCRIIGITLFAENNLTGEMKEFTLYYPTTLRTILAKKQITHEDSFITNLDDVFFFHAFGEVIYKESRQDTTHVKFDPREPTDFSVFSNRVKTEIIEVAHSYWVKI